MSESVAEAPGAGSPAGLGETGTSHELLQRLRELEAENSALAQANENQRETYERCLDEVANHVVQALLNQKDLREECIKLKKRVFELERQNQVLSDLFQQKLQLSTGSLPQLPLHPVPVPPDVPVTPQPGSAEPPPLLPGLCLSLPECVVSPGPRCPLLSPSLDLWCPHHPRRARGIILSAGSLRCHLSGSMVLPPVPSGSPGLSPGAPPLDALSPFFKKKAQILEVLRKLEETDPLLGPAPASPGSPEPCAALGWPPCPLRGPGAAGGWRGAEGSPCSSPEEGGPPRGALLSALAERLLRGEGGGCCRRNGEAPGGPPRQRRGEHPAFLGLYTPGEESPEGGFVLKLPPPAAGLRLSPQLAHPSKIPCRGAHPEASPALSRRPSPDAPPEPGSAEPPSFPQPRTFEAVEQPPVPPAPVAGGERAAASPPASRRGAGGSAPCRRPGKKPPEPGYLPFKERLAALGKLRGAEGREPPGPGRPERGHGAELRPLPRGGLGGSLKHPEPAHGAEPLARCYSSGSMGDPGKAGGAKGRPGSGRTPSRTPPAPPAKASRSPHGSPTKLPTKAGKAGAARGEEAAGAKAGGGPHKTPAEPEPVGPAPSAAGHSAIEEKVMKGIEENVLRLQGQERAPGAEAKGKAAGLASWFGLRRSKLPALSRRGDGGRGREWAGTPAPLRREVKLAARKLEAESLNISKLMEKAEDLRKALREEHAFLQGLALEKGRPRGPPRGPGPLPVMYQEVTAETFMQQLLDRVDGKDAPYETWLEHKRELCDLRRVPPDAKEPRLCRPPRNGIVGHLREPSDKVPDVGLRDELPSDESLSESQHFAACGSLTRTLDSGIGTFPPPDYGGVPAKSTPKPRGRPEPLPGAVPAAVTKVPRKARTLEREVPSAEELPPPGKHRSAPSCRLPAPPGSHGHRAAPQDTGDEARKARRVQQSKNWTFPNAKACGAADPFVCPPGGLEGLHRPVQAPVCSPAGHRGASPEAPPPLPPALSASSSRTPSASDVGDEGSTEARSRDGGHGPAGLEHSESLSDSLYDSLSSCGSQG
ncbi:LOW QUALITY PROTEIN: nck-associated protein 5-like [Hirundo rustica]|uniref:LOW QUALITY PROTEIN: nck-associated protein 5-like n=1 Tax=Hirundo rustica TaxID=43150 RepID=UPI001A94142F|nr:LOW QUALITY PROTEIN: nck-associated protein 5-like [Hirundo rustica]